jgi:hypothetical protein
MMTAITGARPRLPPRSFRRHACHLLHLDASRSYQRERPGSARLYVYSPNASEAIAYTSDRKNSSLTSSAGKQHLDTQL